MTAASHPYALFLWSAQQFQHADLILSFSYDGLGRRHSNSINGTSTTFTMTASPRCRRSARARPPSSPVLGSTST